MAVVTVGARRDIGAQRGAATLAASHPHAAGPMTTLARFSAGRILLHVIAMLGDRSVAFHAAGIARELSRAAGPFAARR